MLFGRRTVGAKRIAKMNVIIFLPIIIAIVVALTGCGVTKGSIVILDKANGAGFSIDYNEWSDIDTCSLELNKGDVIDVEISHQSGKIGLSIIGLSGNEAYAGNDMSPCSFSVTINEADKYIIKINGNNASGHISIDKR